MPADLKGLKSLAKKSAFGISSIALIGCLIYQFQLGSKVAHSNRVLTGLITCYTRIYQSFTAFNLANKGQAKVFSEQGIDQKLSKSTYLKEDFKSKTEECVSDLAEIAETDISYNSTVVKSINALGGSVYQFYRVLSKAESPIKWFEKVEKEYQVAKDLLFKYQASQWATLKVLSLSLFASVSLVLIISFKSLIGFGQVKSAGKRFEEEAELELKRGYKSTFSQNIVQQLICRVLEANGFRTCAKLLVAASKMPEVSSVSQGVAQKVENKSELVIPAKSLPQLKEKTPEVKNDGAIPISDLNLRRTAIDEIVKSVVDTNSSEILNLGASLHVNVPKNLRVFGEEESLIHSIHLLFSHGVRKLKYNVFDRKLCLLGEAKGDEFILNILDTGEAFEKELTKLDFKTILQNKTLDKNIQIAAEIVRQVGGRISLHNYFSASGNKAHGHVKSYLKLASPRQVEVVKGKKRDIQEMMEAV